VKKKLRFHPKKVTVLRSKCSSDDFAQMLAGIIVGRLKSDPTIAIFQDFLVQQAVETTQLRALTEKCMKLCSF